MGPTGRPRVWGGRCRRRFLVLALILGLNPPGPAVGGALPEPGGDLALIQVFRPASMEFRGGDVPLFQAETLRYEAMSGGEAEASRPVPALMPFLYNGGA